MISHRAPVCHCTSHSAEVLVAEGRLSRALRGRQIEGVLFGWPRVLTRVAPAVLARGRAWRGLRQRRRSSRWTRVGRPRVVWWAEHRRSPTTEREKLHHCAELTSRRKRNAPCEPECSSIHSKCE